MKEEVLWHFPPNIKRNFSYKKQNALQLEGGGKGKGGRGVGGKGIRSGSGDALFKRKERLKLKSCVSMS